MAFLFDASGIRLLVYLTRYPERVDFFEMGLHQELPVYEAIFSSMNSYPGILKHCKTYRSYLRVARSLCTILGTVLT